LLRKSFCTSRLAWIEDFKKAKSELDEIKEKDQRLAMERARKKAQKQMSSITESFSKSLEQRKTEYRRSKRTTENSEAVELSDQH